MHIRHRMGLLSVLVFSCVLGGCSRLTPASVGDFGAEKTVLVTLRDGETIKGHIDVGESVIFTTFGRVYRAEVEEIGDNGDMILTNAYLQEEYEQFSLQRQRMEGSVLQIHDDTDRISIPAYKIVSVEEISMDRMKSARAAGFWGFTIFVVSRILSARL